jgi:hypothetical protein
MTRDLKTRYAQLYPHLRFFATLKNKNNETFVKELRKRGYSIESVQAAISSMQQLQKEVDRSATPPQGLKSKISLILKQTDPLLLWIETMFRQNKKSETNKRDALKKKAFTDVLDLVTKYKKVLGEATSRAGRVVQVRGRQNVNLNTHGKYSARLKNMDAQIDTYIRSIHDPDIKTFIQEHPLIQDHHKYYSLQRHKYNAVIQQETQGRYDTYFEAQWNIRDALKHIQSNRIEQALDAISRAEHVMKRLKPIDFRFIHKHARFTAADIQHLQNEIRHLKLMIQKHSKNTFSKEDLKETIMGIQSASKNVSSANQVRSFLLTPGSAPPALLAPASSEVKNIVPVSTGVTIFRNNDVTHTQFPLLIVFLIVAGILKKLFSKKTSRQTVSQMATYQSNNNNLNNTATSYRN